MLMPIDACDAMLAFIVTVSVWLVVLMFPDLVEFVVTASAAAVGPAAGSRAASIVASAAGSVAVSAAASPVASAVASRTASHAASVVGSVAASDQEQPASGPSIDYYSECT